MQLQIKELKYQSSLELDERTFDRLRTIPIAEEIVRHARQDLVKRLDDYEFDHPELFQQVVEFIDKKIMPIVAAVTTLLLSLACSAHLQTQGEPAVPAEGDPEAAERAEKGYFSSR